MERTLPEVLAELEAAEALADVAEIAAPLAHEFNNFLNALLLHFAVLELQMTPEEREGLTEIRQQGKSMAALVQQWQGYRRRPTAEGAAADVHEAVRDAVRTLGAASVRLELEPGPLTVAGAASDVRRLVHFLLRNAVASSPDGAVVVSTGRNGGTIVLRVADAGPPLAEEQLTELFDLYPPRRLGINGLELAACKAIVRRLLGQVSAQNGASGGVTVTVELPAI